MPGPGQASPPRGNSIVMPITDIASQLRRDEGFRNFPYADIGGKLTIGVGRNLTDRGLSNLEIEFLLQNDIAQTRETLVARLPWFSNLDPIRQAVIVNMAFNLGFNGLEKFSALLAAAAKGDWATAGREMLDSAWARQVGDRANRLAQQIVSGQWQ
jgi:lysozyme